MTIPVSTPETSSISIPVGGGKFASVPAVAFSTNQRWVAHPTIRQMDGDTAILDHNLFTVSFVPRGLSLSQTLTKQQALYLVSRLPYFDTGFKHVNRNERRYKEFMQRWRKIALAMKVTQ